MIIWNKDKYRIENLNVIIYAKEIQDFLFDKKIEYNFQFIKKLGEGKNGMVSRFKISSKFNDKNIILAGKLFIKSKNLKYIQDYILSLIFLKKLGICNIANLKFLDLNSNEQKDVKIKINIFKNKNFDLSRIIFFEDLSLINGVKKVFSISESGKLNYEFLNLKQLERNKIYLKIIDDFKILLKNNLFLDRSFDSWIITIDKTGVAKSYFLDIDKICLLSNFNFKNKKELINYFKNLIISFFDSYLENSKIDLGNDLYSDYRFLLDNFENMINLNL